MGDIRLTPNTDFFVIPQSCSSYGARIFIREDIASNSLKPSTILEMLKGISCWNGHDKVWVDSTSKKEFLGFELPFNLSDDVCLLTFIQVFENCGLKNGQHIC
jgi:hypothetical protein